MPVKKKPAAKKTAAKKKPAPKKAVTVVSQLEFNALKANVATLAADLEKATAFGVATCEQIEAIKKKLADLTDGISQRFVGVATAFQEATHTIKILADAVNELAVKSGLQPVIGITIQAPAEGLDPGPLKITSTDDTLPNRPTMTSDPLPPQNTTIAAGKIY